MKQTSNNPSNMIKAVHFCIDKQLFQEDQSKNSSISLTQEGLTLLEEGVISFIMGDDYNDWKLRKYVSAYLSQYGKDAENYDDTWFRKNRGEEKVDYYKNKIDNFHQIDEWRSLYQTLNSVRNDVNHAGMNDSPSIPDKIMRNLKRCYDKAQELITEANKLEEAISERSTIALELEMIKSDSNKDF